MGGAGDHRLRGTHTESNQRLMKYLGMAFAAKMTRRGSAGNLHFPLVDRQLQVPALDYEPVDRSGRHDSADFAFEFVQGRHGEQEPATKLVWTPAPWEKRIYKQCCVD